MRITDILTINESFHGNDLEIIYTIKYSLDGDILHGGFTAKAELNDVEYQVDLFYNIKTNKYKLEQINVTDGDQSYDGDNVDKELIDSFLANNLSYIVNKILNDD